jgi:Tfp pilus assembly protein PilE
MRKALTVIEVLIIVAVIFIIASIFIPVFRVNAHYVKPAPSINAERN